MSGVIFPKTSNGDRSTTSFNKNIYSEMAKTLGDTDLADRILNEKDWRWKYNILLNRLVEHLISGGVTAAGAGKTIASLKTGLKELHNMDFEVTECAPAVPLEQAVSAPAAGTPAFGTAKFQSVVSPQPLPDTTLSVPYKGDALTGAALEVQCDKWVTYGTMEADCGRAIKDAMGKVDCLRGRTFILLGAGSELGPAKLLLRAGATVVAIATRKPARWSELIKLARESAGTLVLPVPAGTDTSNEEAVAKVAGADLIKEAPQLVAWVVNCAKEANGLVTVGTYLYMDGEANVRITAVSDCIVERVAKELGPERVSFAWLASCSTSMVLPEAAHQARAGHYAADATWWQKAVGERVDSPPIQIEGCETPVRLFDGFETMQGPNYALAQLARQWRAAVLAADGFVVSTPVTPMCRTASVCSNKTMAAALDGVAYVKPMEAYQPETCRALMFGVLISDLADGPVKPGPTPMHVLARKAFHSGRWRCPFSLSSLGKVTYVLGMVAGRQSIVD